MEPLFLSTHERVKQKMIRSKIFIMLYYCIILMLLYYYLLFWFSYFALANKIDITVKQA